MTLHLAWCSASAARFAVEQWHYSKKMPRFKVLKIGAWEDGKFIGCVLFGQGATPEYGKEFNLSQFQVCELVRVALGQHEVPTTKVVAIALKLLRKQSPGIRLVLSFADTREGHIGAIYQAGNWIYLGERHQEWLRVNGILVHPKTMHSRYGKGGQSIPWLRENVDRDASRERMLPKHKYAMPMDEEMRSHLSALAKPYPKRSDPLG